MDFGLNFFPVLPPEQKTATDYFDETLALARQAEELGFEHVQTVEHYGSGYGGYCPDPVTLLAAIAARTSTIRIVTGAVIPAFTHPIKLAGKLAMLDHLSHGRLDVGFGRAFLPDEFTWFDVPMTESRSRFAEGIEACRALWSQTDVTFAGAHHTFGPITLLPRPVQQPHPPIFVASATSGESCAAAGTAGHHLQLVPSVTSREQLVANLAAYREAWAAAGHPAGGARVQIKYTCYLGDDGDVAREHAERWENNYVALMGRAVAAWSQTRSADYPGYEAFVEKVARYDFATSLADRKVLAGNPDEVGEQLEAIRGWFGDDVVVSLQVNPGAMPVAESQRALELFGEKVMPSFAPAAR